MTPQKARQILALPSIAAGFGLGFTLAGMSSLWALLALPFLVAFVVVAVSLWRSRQRAPRNYTGRAAHMQAAATSAATCRSVKFIQLNSKQRRAGGQWRRHIPCSRISGCYPAASAFCDNGRGCCVGLIDKANDLDCLRLCVRGTTVDDAQGCELVTNLHMTPTEALEMAGCLIEGAKSALWLNPEYEKHHKHMVEMRDNGDLGEH